MQYSSRANPQFAAAVQSAAQRRQQIENDPERKRRQKMAEYMRLAGAAMPLAGAAIGGIGGGIAGGVAGAGAGGVGAVPGAISGAGAGIGAGSAIGAAGGQFTNMMADQYTADDDRRLAEDQARMQSAMALMQMLRR